MISTAVSDVVVSAVWEKSIKYENWYVEQRCTVEFTVVNL